MLFALAFVPFIQGGQKPPERVSSLTGNIQKHLGFESKALGNKRNLWVYLPPNYAKEPNRHFPVLYMADGQNLFDGLTSYIPNQEWMADESAEALISTGLIEPIIIVGIDNAEAKRADEYLPTRVKRTPTESWGGDAEKYSKMVIEEIKPFIDRSYRTKTDAANTGLGGSSFGGIITLYMGLNHPNVFGKLVLCSPSIWWDSRVMLKQTEALKSKTRQRIWIDAGTGEGSMVPDALALTKIFQKKGWTLGKDLVFYKEGGGTHSEVAWARRFPAILMFMFGRR